MNRQFHRLISRSSNLIALIDEQAALSYLNGTAKAALGCTADDYKGHSLFEWVHPDDAALAAEFVRLLVAAPDTFRTAELRFCRHDGTYLWLEIDGTNLVHDPGVREIVLNARDITERKKTETAELEQRSFVDAMRESLAALTSSLDVDQVLQKILTYAGKVVPSDGGSIIMFDGEKMRVAYLRGFAQEAADSIHQHEFTRSKAHYAEMLLKREPYIIADTLDYPSWEAFTGTEWIRSSLGIPIVVGDSVVGALVSDSAVPNHFHQSDIEKLQAFARYASLALENAYHVAQLEEKVAKRTAELTHSKERVEAILNYSIDAIVLASSDLLIQQTNAAFDLLFASQPDAYVNRSLLDCIHADDVERARQVIQTVIEQRSGRRLEVHAYRQDGTVFDAELSIGSVHAQRAIHEGLVCTIRDISQRKAREIALRYHASLQQTISDGVISSDMNFCIQSWNRAAETIYGWSADDVLGKRIIDVLQTQYASEEERQSIIQHVVQEGAWEGEVVQKHRDGSERYIYVSMTLLKHNDGTPYGVVAVSRDMTERRAVEEALRIKREADQEFQQHLTALHQVTLELTQIDHLDDFFRRTIELGRERFGFERMALFLYDVETNLAVGTYGTDIAGNITDERHIRFSPEPTGVLQQALLHNARLYFKENTRLYMALTRSGEGWNAAAILWDGSKSLGWLVADNELNHKPATQPLLDILSLYALAVGALLARKLTNAIRRESEARYRLLAENATDVVVRMNAAGDYVYVSPSITSVTGYTTEELTGQTRFAFIHPDDLPRVREGFSTVFKRRDHVERMTYRFRHKAGHYIWIEAVGRAVFSETTSESLEFVYSARDISERMRVEIELQRRESWYRALARNIPGTTVILFDRDLNYLLVEGESTFFARAAREGKNAREFLPEVGLADWLPRYEETLRGEYVRLEYGYDDQINDVQFVPIRDENGEVSNGLIVIRNITAERNAERTIRENEERLRILFDNVPDALILMTLDGVCVDVNPAALQLAKVTRDRIVGKNFFELPLISPKDKERVRESLEQSRRGNRDMYEYRINLSDGASFMVEVHTHSVTIQGERLHLSMVRDITARKQAEESLRKTLQSEKELGELKSRFVSTASHEFRTPLATIMSSSELLLTYRHRMTDERVQEKLSSIVQQVKSLTGIINDVLDLSRLESGRIDFKPAPVALDALCDEIVSEFQNQSGMSHPLHFTCTDSPLILNLDKGLMRQVITNLVGNAIKYSPENAAISVHLERSQDDVILSVQDRGIGIPEADVRRLFEPFHRAANVGTISGTGLGLSIVAEAVKLHGGTISVESEVGLGSTFRVSLPLDREVIAAD